MNGGPSFLGLYKRLVLILSRFHGCGFPRADLDSDLIRAKRFYPRHLGEETRLPKSIKLYQDAKTLGSGTVLGFLFGDREETINAPNLTVERMKQVNTLPPLQWMPLRYGLCGPT